MKAPPKAALASPSPTSPRSGAWCATRTSRQQRQHGFTLSTYAGSVGARSINVRPRRARRENDVDREEINRIAREAGAGIGSSGRWLVTQEELERIADVIEDKTAAKERYMCRVAARNAVLALSETNRRSGDLLDHVIDVALRA